MMLTFKCYILIFMLALLSPHPTPETSLTSTKRVNIATKRVYRCYKCRDNYFFMRDIFIVTKSGSISRKVVPYLLDPKIFNLPNDRPLLTLDRDIIDIIQSSHTISEPDPYLKTLRKFSNLGSTNNFQPTEISLVLYFKMELCSKHGPNFSKYKLTIKNRPVK